MKNLDKKTVQSFGEEWNKFDQSNIKSESYRLFKKYFSIFPMNKISKSSVGFDMGCGSGRFAQFIAPKVKLLNCIDPSDAIYVAKKKMKNYKNVKYLKKSVDKSGLKKNSQDFGFSIGVLHHIPDTKAGINSCVKLLKKNAPLLIYLYYSFENRPLWFKILWGISDLLRRLISKMPNFLKIFFSDLLSLIIYFPLSRFVLLLKKINLKIKNFPLYDYHDKTFYMLRTDSRDRFGTPLEQRFSKKQIKKMMEDAGLVKIKFRKSTPFWTAVGFKG